MFWCTAWCHPTRGLVFTAIYRWSHGPNWHPPPVATLSLSCAATTTCLVLQLVCFQIYALYHVGSALNVTRAVQSQPFNIMHATYPEHLNLHFIIWDILLNIKLYVRTAESRILCQHWFYSTIVVNRSLRVWNERTLRPKCHRRPSHSELSRYRQMAEITLGWQLFAATGLSACIGHGIR